MTSKMDVRIWEGGLTLHEINAIEKIQTVFCAGGGKKKTSQPSRGGSLREQLGDATGRSSSQMWPWKGYAGFRFFDSKGYEGEFDLVIITHCLVLIVELKHWNGDLTSGDGNWYLNGKEKGRSPVAVTQNKQYLLKKKLEKHGGKFISLKDSRYTTPKIEFRVVLTGSATPVNLPESDRFKTMTLDEFLSLADEEKFNKNFRPHPKSHGTNKDIPLFDEIFSDKQTRPKHLIINGYMAVEKIFPLHDDEHVYKEFKAVSEANKSDEALLRQWNFSKIPDPTAKTPEGRFKIVSREQDVLSFIRHHDYELYQHCLRSLKTISPQEVTQQFHELYELPPGHSRFNEFVGRHLESMPEDGRVALVKILLDFFARLHAIKVAHRDIADHSLWVSPSKNIAVSSFIAAYHQPIGTVGEPRASLSVRAIPLPECDVENSKADTPFADDVYYLGILAWLILKAKRLSELNLKEIKPDLTELGDWYSPIIKKAVENNPADRYVDASAFFEAFTGGVPQGKAIKIFDESDLEPFRKSIRLLKEFPDDEYLLDGETKEVYRSGDCVVKVWNDISPSDKTPEVGAKVLHFLKRVESLRSMQPDYLPTIRDFGLATRTSQLYLVQDFIEGRPWSALVADAKELTVENRIATSIKLVDAVEHLHELNSYHGDLHPENVLIVSGETEDAIFLIDTPDFDFLSGESRNHRYSPEAIDASSPIERDNYGVTRLCAELLELDWVNPTCIEGLLTDIAEAIQVEKASEAGFASLRRLKDALIRALEDKPTEAIVSVGMRNAQVQDSLSILPDNGNIYVSVTNFKNEAGKVVVSLFGIGGQLRAVYDPEKAEIEFCYPPKRFAEIPARIRENADFLIDVRMTVGSESSDRFDELKTVLEAVDVFHTRIREILHESRAEDTSAQGTVPPNAGETVLETRDISKKAPSEIEESRSILTLRNKIPTTKAIWQATIDTEAEALPRIEVADDPRLSRESTELVVPFSSNGEVLEAYTRDDRVELIRLSDEKTITIGRVIISRSTPAQLLVALRPGKFPRVTTGETLFLRTAQDRSSFLRRKTALTRIIERRGVVNDLIDYFEPTCHATPKALAEFASEQDFAAYDRIDEQGNKISLNEEQRVAFNRLLTNGPLSLLQGPPGTGKTEFIAAFVHYLVAKLGVHNILLVSQSHEAINTAAERIRRHCRRLNTPLDVVRFSNSEGAVSDELLDAYAKNIVSEKLALFEAEFDQRVLALQSAFGVPKDYLISVLDAEREVARRVIQWKRLDLDCQSDDFSPDEKVRMKSAKMDIRSELNQILRSKYKVETPEKLPFEEMLGHALRRVSYEYGIAPHEEQRVQALLRIGKDFKEKLATERVNFDEFLGRSRTLVCGTCVGVGQQHIGIKDNQYDWVIIDEAARSSASELAVAMQSGKRILLVGDHQQLPPLYQDEHKLAVARKLGLTSRDEALAKAFLSDFERCFESAYGSQVGATLRTQYRMIQPIGDLVSEVFYKGELKTAKRDMPPCFSKPPEVLSNSVTWIDTSGMGENGYHSDDSGNSIYNEAEINTVLSILKSIEEDAEFCELLDGTLKEGEAGIGVICMYGEQKRRLRRKFHELEWTEEFKKLVKIDTVDSYQGKENRIVILSLTRNHPSSGPGFLKESNRINVSMSRAMDRLLIVGSTQMWSARNEGTPLNKVLSFFRERGEPDYAFLPAENVLKRGLS